MRLPLTQNFIQAPFLIKTTISKNLVNVNNRMNMKSQMHTSNAGLTISKQYLKNIVMRFKSHM